jgi:hypothetical protein
VNDKNYTIARESLSEGKFHNYFSSFGEIPLIGLKQFGGHKIYFRNRKIEMQDSQQIMGVKLTLRQYKISTTVFFV